MNTNLIFILSFIFLLSQMGCTTEQPSESQPYNVLFITVDDLRPQLGCYGKSYMHTPHMDRLAAEGRLFSHHYVQVPTCGASRFAMLRGQRPTIGGHIGNRAIRYYMGGPEDTSTYTSFPHLFREQGYYTVALGKIGHYVDGKVYTYEGEGDGHLEMPQSWDEIWGPVGKWKTAWNAFFGYADGSNRNSLNNQVAPYESASVPDTAYPDGVIAEKALETLDELANKKQPFLLAVGFFKPHLPFTAPQKYWDLYNRDSIPLSPNPEAPVDVHPTAIHRSGEMFGNYQLQPELGGKGIRISDEYARTLRHGYFASVSFADAQIGKVLDKLEETGLADHTIVVLWGDHGWHLGDHTIWGKHSAFEKALHSAMIMRVPGMNAPGVATDAIVESVDIYPTLTELCELPAPVSLSGQSLVPYLNLPDLPTTKPAIGHWGGRVTLRTDRYRLTLYNDPKDTPAELFDHAEDPYETRNVASQYAQVIDSLSQILMPYQIWDSE